MSAACPDSLTITSRDIQILHMIYGYDTCSIDQLQVRIFPQNRNRFARYGRKVACYRRVARLRQAGYLRADRLGSSSGVGSGKSLLSLGPKGRAVLAECLELSRAELKRLREVATPQARDHHLAIGDFRLLLELACNRYPLLELEWVSERELRNLPVSKVEDPRAGSASKPPQIPLIADGRLTITLPNHAAQSFELEMDMGTVPVKRIQTKLAGYLALAKDHPRLILWVVPNRRRLQALTTWALGVADSLKADPTIFWITTRERVTEQSILSAIWQVVGVAEPQSLLPQVLLPQLSPSEYLPAQFLGGPNV